MSTDTGTEALASSVQRTVLGLLLTLLVLVGLSLADGLLAGDYLVGAFGAVVALGAGFWLVSLLREALAG